MFLFLTRFIFAIFKKNLCKNSILLLETKLYQIYILDKTKYTRNSFTLEHALHMLDSCSHNPTDKDGSFVMMLLFSSFKR